MTFSIIFNEREDDNHVNFIENKPVLIEYRVYSNR